MERMTRADFRVFYDRFHRPQAIWQIASGWTFVGGHSKNEVTELTAQDHMEEIIVQWADAIRANRGQRNQSALPPLFEKWSAPLTEDGGERRSDD